MTYYFERLQDLVVFFKCRKKSFITYYATLVNREAKNEYLAVEGSDWTREGLTQFHYLVKQGLQPHHALLDIGCGSLRGGVCFIRYLNESNYTGMDISSEILKVAKSVIRQNRLESKKPTIILNSDMSLKEICNQKFDYIYAYSVLSHMPVGDVDELFKNLHIIMKSGTRFYASYFETDGDYRSTVSKRNFHYPLAVLKNLAFKYNLILEKMPEMTDQGKQCWVRIGI